MTVGPSKPDLYRALDALVDYLFAGDDPTPAKLEDCRESLPDGYLSLASLFLNVRLMVRWSRFGVSHGNVRVIDGASAEALTLEIRVYDPAEMRRYVEYCLRRAGFLNIGYRNEHLGGMGGWVSAAAPPQLLDHLRE